MMDLIDLPPDPEAHNREANPRDGRAFYVELGDFSMARDLVLAGQWAHFYRAVHPPDGAPGWRPRAGLPFSDLDRQSIEGLPTQPVRYVSFFDGWHYTTWLTDSLRARARAQVARGCRVNALPPLFRDLLPKPDGGRGWRLNVPSEAEWERAARGKNGRRYPWGWEFDANCNYGGPPLDLALRAVGGYPGGRSPDAIEEACGTVWQWTRSRLMAYPYKPDPAGVACEGVYGSPEVRRVVRGSCFLEGPRQLRCAHALSFTPQYADFHVGLRLSMSPFGVDPVTYALL